jgi:cytochrome b involved in lipid metabolism
VSRNPRFRAVVACGRTSRPHVGQAAVSLVTARCQLLPMLHGAALHARRCMCANRRGHSHHRSDLVHLLAGESTDGPICPACTHATAIQIVRPVGPRSARAFANMVKEYTLEEVATHNKVTDAWIIVDGEVADITSWIKRHPGGELVLGYYAGKDASEAFWVNHFGDRAKTLFRSMVVGRVTSFPPLTEAAIEHRKLHVYFQEQGWYTTRMRDYYNLAAFLLTLFVLAFYLAYKGYAVPCALVIAAMWQQVRAASTAQLRAVGSGTLSLSTPTLSPAGRIHRP